MSKNYFTGTWFSSVVSVLAMLLLPLSPHGSDALLLKLGLFFVSDQIVAYLMVTSGTAVLEILYLAYNGDREVSWSEACTSYGKFCYRMKLAVILHALALSCFIILAVISAYRAFSIFEPPLVPSKVVEGDRA
ncbi:hypothetical protein NC653_026107 [Populus alba x Populus x berolinensis]|uniref:CASP-like protein n=1 Tax=Populus alba x Populus x berolinensis TaxID=444605 RepID=A0AAD6MCY6_9ROSI|nr:hypothetical protein NC653_026107 [Populus alba x Populus x berolinensis]